MEKESKKLNQIIVRINDDYFEMFNYLKAESCRGNKSMIEFLIKQEFLKQKKASKGGGKNAD